MTKITNTAAGPRGVLLADGTTHYVEPGQTADLDVADNHQLYDGLVTGDEGDKVGEPGPLDGSIEQLAEHVAGLADIDEVEALIAAETAGKSRKGALAVLDARKAELAPAT